MWKYCCAVLGLAVCASRGLAIAPGTLDDFQDGTFQGWQGGSAENVSTGGPGGTGDRFLRAASNEIGFPSRVAIYNFEPRWVGDYTAAGVTQLEMDMKIISGPALSMRVVLIGGDSFGTRATSTLEVVLPDDGQWHHLVFPITAADLTVVLGGDSAANVLTTVNRLLIRHQSGAPFFQGTPVTANVGFDNIKAGPVAAPVSITQWRSVREHAGPVELPVALDASATGNGITGPTVETRDGGVLRIEVDFSDPVSVPPEAVSVTGRTTVGGVPESPVAYVPSVVSMLDADTLQILFTPDQLPDQTCYAIDISPAGVAGLTGDHDVMLRALVGDATMSGGITLSDALLTQSRIGTSLPTAPQYDIDLDAAIGPSDVLVAKDGIGLQALCP